MGTINMVIYTSVLIAWFATSVTALKPAGIAPTKVKTRSFNPLYDQIEESWKRGWNSQAVPLQRIVQSDEPINEGPLVYRKRAEQAYQNIDAVLDRLMNQNYEKRQYKVSLDDLF